MNNNNAQFKYDPNPTPYNNFAELECYALARLAQQIGEQAHSGMSRQEIKNAHAVNGRALPDELFDIAMSINIGESQE